MWTSWPHIFSPMSEAASGQKSRKILWNDSLEISFKELKCMISVKTLFSCLYWAIPFIFHTDVYDQQLDAVISQNNKPIEFFSRIQIAIYIYRQVQD